MPVAKNTFRSFASDVPSAFVRVPLRNSALISKSSIKADEGLLNRRIPRFTRPEPSPNCSPHCPAWNRDVSAEFSCPAKHTGSSDNTSASDLIDGMVHLRAEIGVVRRLRRRARVREETCHVRSLLK